MQIRTCNISILPFRDLEHFHTELRTVIEFLTVISVFIEVIEKCRLNFESSWNSNTLRIAFIFEFVSLSTVEDFCNKRKIIVNFAISC